MAKATSPLRASADRSRFALGLIALLFGISGLAALINETIWIRWLTLALGSSARATVLVLTVFMGGLGVGAWLAGRWLERGARHALRAFAAAEAGVAIWAWLTIVLLGQWLPTWAAALARTSGADALTLPGRLLLATLALAPPTMLMGATLPLLARGVVDRGGVPARAVGILYTLNTLGGALGALLAPFFLIERLGLRGSVALAGGLEALIALIAWRWAAGTAAVSPRDATRHDDNPGNGRDIAWPIAVTAYFVSGFVGLALEVVTFRVLTVLLGSSSYALAVMLAAFLIGIGVGSWLGTGRAERTSDPLALVIRTLAWLALGCGAALALLSLLGGSGALRLPFALPAVAALPYATELTLCLVVLLPATLALGAVVPAIGQMAARSHGWAGRFGTAYAFNTLGAVLGAALAGSWLIPTFGTHGTAVALTLLTVALSLVALIKIGAARQRSGLTVITLGILGLVLAAGSDPTRRAFESRFGNAALLELREGSVQTIAVVQEDNEQQLSFLRLVTNQTSLTGTHLYAQRYMGLLGHLPALFAQKLTRALVICLGTGMTAAAVASHPELTQLQIVEISPEVAAVDPRFRSANHNVLADPRVKLQIEDGRHALLAAQQPYDLITLEPPPPRDSGVVSLYSRDFYALCRRRLAPGGVVAQWIPLHSQSEAEVRMLVRSFVDQFPYALGVMAVERDLILLGSDAPLTRSLDALATRMSAPSAAESLRAIGFVAPVDLLATITLDRTRLLALTEGAAVVDDDRPQVEHFARYGRRPPLPPVASWLEPPASLASLVEGEIPPAQQVLFDRARQAQRAMIDGALAHEAGRTSAGNRLLNTALGLRPDDQYLRWAALASDEHLARLEKRALANRRVDDWLLLGSKRNLRQEYPLAAAAFQNAVAADPTSADALANLGVVLSGPLRRPTEGCAFLKQAIDRMPAGSPQRGRLEQLHQAACGAGATARAFDE